MKFFKQFVGLTTLYFCLTGNPLKAYAGEGATIYEVENSNNASYGQTIWNNSFGSTPRYGNNITITTYGSGDGAGIGNSAGVYSNYGGDMIVGNYLTIETSGEHADGIRTNPSGYSNWKDSIGTVTIGDNLKITTHGDSADGINANGYSKVNVGDNATIITTYDGPNIQGAHGVRANFGSSINIGDNLTVSTSGKYSYGLYTTLGLGSSNDGGSNITVGNNSYIVANGPYSHAVYASSKNGYISVGDNATFITKGNNSHGVYIGGQNSSITLGENTSIATSGDNSHAIYLNSATGRLDFEGGLDVSIAGENSYAIFVNSGYLSDEKKVATYNDDNTNETINNKYTISGNLKTGAKGFINVNLGDGSWFKGTADQTTGTINLKLHNGSVWHATDSWNANVSLDEGSHLYLGENEIRSDSYVAKGQFLIDGGTIHFDSDIVDSRGDLLQVEEQITGSGGKISVKNQGYANTDGTEIVKLIEAKQGGSEFELLSEVELGGYSYSLDNTVESDGSVTWFLKGTRLAPTSKGAIHIFSGNYLLDFAETSTLLKRMGELHNSKGKGDVWARSFTGKIKSNVHPELGNYRMTYSGFEFGNDKLIAQSDQGDRKYLGWMASYSQGNLSYSEGSGQIDSKSLGAYYTHIKKDGSYIDVVAKYNFTKDTFSTIDSQNKHVTGKANTQGVSLSIEAGKQIKLNQNGLYIEPQAQITAGHQKGATFHATNGLKINISNYNYFLGRIGFNLGYKLHSKNPTNVYLKTNYIKEFDSKTSYYLNNSKNDVSFADSKFNVGLGITTQINKKQNLYFEIERTFGKKFNQPFAISFGYRMSF